MKKTKVSIVIPVHNALRYFFKCLRTLKCTRDVEHEIVVVDNASRALTRMYQSIALGRGYIDRLLCSKENLFFSKGNNLGVLLADKESTHILLLNSDVQVNSPDWLSVLLDNHTRGATAFGYVDSPPKRADGYCFLIDIDLYCRYQLDTDFPWWWSITKLQAQLLNDGYTVTAIKEHEKYLHHLGGKSKVPDKVLAESKEYDIDEIKEWFGNNRVTVIERV